MISKSNIDARVQIYESEYRAIIAEACRLPKIETGGDLFGTFTHGSKPIIWLASGPGPKVRHENTHFEQDTVFTTYWERRLTKDFGLQYIGSWHSHHFLGLQRPSSGDINAAQIYAQQHNRQTTLEIIVNHEHSNQRRGESDFSTALRPYFYPNAQNAKAEGCILSKFILLAGESPIRQQLGKTDLASFNTANWRQATSFQLPITSPPQNYPHQPSDNDETVIIPDVLGLEIQSIADVVQEFDIQQNSSTFLVSITLSTGLILALAIQKSQELNIIQVNLINRSTGLNENISTILNDEMGISFSINQHNKGLLKKLIRAVPPIQRRILEKVEEDRRKSKIEAELLKFKVLKGEQPSNQRELTILKLEAKLAETEQQLQQLQNTSQHKEDQLEALGREAQQLKLQYYEAQKQLDTQLTESQRQLEDQKTEIKLLLAQQELAKEKLAMQQTLEMELLELKEKIHIQQRLTNQQRSEAQQELEVRLNDTQQQLDARKSEVQELETRLREAQEKLAAQQELEVRLNDTQQQLDARQHKAQELETRLREAQEKLAAQQELEVRLNDTQQQLDARQHKAQELETRLREAQEKLAAQQELEVRLNDAHYQLDALQQEAQRLKDELNNTQKSLNVAHPIKNILIRIRGGPVKSDLKVSNIIWIAITAAILLIIVVLIMAILIKPF